jgi:hypothetical protein
MHKLGSLLELEDIGNPQNGSTQRGVHARKEFFHFVSKTYEELCKIETKLLTSRSCIRVFCRIDVGIMVVNNKVDYFVNEVERSHNTSLWNNPPPGTKYTDRVDMFSVTFGQALDKWISGLLRK